MAPSLPGTRISSQHWREHHTAFVRLSADRCLDRERLEAAAARIADADIDAFHQVGQVSEVVCDTAVIGN